MKNIKHILEKIRSITEHIFGENLVGIYVHGSYAFGCFNWEKSDIDYLVVIRNPITLMQKVDYMTEILRLNEESPEKGIEMSVVLEKDCKKFVYPMPFELHFSNSHLERAKKDLMVYCENMHGVDLDLAAHITVTRAVGITLYGIQIPDVFAPVPREAYLDSIRRDVENALSDILENPVYIILNLCRVLAYIKDETILSKAQGGAWGLENLPDSYHDLIQEALASYESNTPYPLEMHRENLKRFAKDMLKRIFVIDGTF